MQALHGGESDNGEKAWDRTYVACTKYLLMVSSGTHTIMFALSYGSISVLFQMVTGI